MATLRKEKKNSFTVIDNDVFKNHSLSLKAKGLLCQMLSLPDGWEYSVQGLATLTSDGQSAITSGLKELEAAGYFRREQKYKDGKFDGYEYIISETPFCDFPKTENPITENTLTENTLTENRQQLNTNELITKKSNTKGLVTKARNVIPPTEEMVQSYVLENGYNVNVQSFMDYYESKGWVVGKAKMKDWQAAVRNWSRNEYSKPSKSANPYWDMLREGSY